MCKVFSYLFDFLFIQEHFLFESQFHNFSKIADNVAFCAVSAMNENEMLSGRLHGGCGIIWKATMENKVEVIETYNNRKSGVILAPSP